MGTIEEVISTARNLRRLWSAARQMTTDVRQGPPEVVTDPENEPTPMHRTAQVDRAMYSAARAILAYGSYGDIDGHEKVAAKLNGSSIGTQPDRDRMVAALNKFRALRNEADYSPFYPAPLGRDAKLALAEGRAVVRICRGLVRSIAKGRGLKL